MPNKVKFGAFEFEPEALELYKHGIRMKLQEQPSRILAILVANPGQIVSRERLQQELWPDASFGEFEAGLNTALSKLRAALGDSASSPVYVERVPRQGYRFVAPVHASGTVAEEAMPLDPVAASGRQSYRRIAAMGAACLAAILGLVAWKRMYPSSSTQAPVRFTINLPTDQELAIRRTAGRAVGISGDGTTLGYLASAGGATQVYVRKLAEAEFRVVPGTQGASDFSLSRDGREVLFLLQAGWMKVETSGANLRAAGETGRRPEAGAIWGEGDAIYAPATVGREESGAAANYFAVYSMSPGQPSARLTPKPGGDKVTYFPEQILPDGRRMLLGANLGPTARWVAALTADDGTITRLVEPGMGGHYLNSGHLVYFWNDTLIAAPFDLASLKTLGPGVPVANRVAANQWVGSQSAISSTGTLAYIPKPSNNRTMVWVSRNGEETALDVPPGAYVFLGLSPSGTRFLVHREEGDQAGIWMYDQNRGGKWTRLVAGTWSSTSAAWSPDEKSVVFTASLQGEQFENLYHMRIDPLGGPERISPSPFGQFVQSWSEKGGIIFTESDRPGTRIDMYRLTWQNGVPHSGPLVTTPQHDSHGSVSPDGRWLVYSSAIDDRVVLYVRPMDAPAAAPGAKVLPEGGYCPMWSPAGDEIFYRRQGAVWSVPIKDGKAAGAPARLFATRSNCRVWNREFGVTGNGKRFLLTEPAADPQERRQIRVVLNWTSELEQLVPARR